MSEPPPHAIDGEWRLPADAPASDRAARPHVQFFCDGRPLTGQAGEPLAVALLAHGIRVFRVMPGSGETRGGFCLVGRCADCLMTVDGVANVRACVTSLRAGMIASRPLGLTPSKPQLDDEDIAP